MNDLSCALRRVGLLQLLEDRTFEEDRVSVAPVERWSNDHRVCRPAHVDDAFDRLWQNEWQPRLVWLTMSGFGKADPRSAS